VTSAAPGHDGFGPVTPEPLSRIRQIAGKRLRDAWTQIPHVTHHEDADVTALEAHRDAHNRASPDAKRSLLAYVARACVRALQAHPRFCASLDTDGTTLWLKQYVNLGIAVETPAGLVVGVLAGADGRSITALAAGILDLATRGRAGALKPTELEGSCFTISSLGGLGGTAFTPIINPPNVAILGVSPARVRPEWIDGAVVPRLVMPLSLSYDHRVIDGADAARFCTRLRAELGDPLALERE
jgi:pyruvate dehydrogenase E2 component (dihydrolipoamide acetyltransferase)